MYYSKLQKLISSFLLFIFFFGQVFGLSFFSLFSNVVNAENREFNDLVSIIVTEDIYDELDREIERYAEDIQGYLDNTRVVILPIKNDTSAFDIASMNENLFYEGYKGLKPGVNFESKLIGTILIGNINLPIVGDNGKTIKSILPFTDFEDKQFIYDPKTKVFEKNKENLDGVKPEIFHGIISPNTGDEEKNIKQIKDFLDKNHDFYTGKNLFDSSKEVLNGKTGEQINENYKPFVFYFDQIRENKSINYISFKGYEAYLNNKEDLLYKRYSQELNDNIQEDINGAKETEINDVLQGIENSEILEAFKNTKTLDVSGAPDSSLRHLIDGSTKKFIEIFNKGTISDFRTNVHNAGRYNEGNSKVNVDMIPYLISVLDDVTDKSLKSANDDLEDYIGNKVKSCVKNIPFPVSVRSAEGLPEKIKMTDQEVNAMISLIDKRKENEKLIESGELKIEDIDEENAEISPELENLGCTSSSNTCPAYDSTSYLPECFCGQAANLDPDDIEFIGDEVFVGNLSGEFKDYSNEDKNNYKNISFEKRKGKEGLWIPQEGFAKMLHNIRGVKFTGEGKNAKVTLIIFNGGALRKVVFKAKVLEKIIIELSSKYDNFYYGKNAEYINDAQQFTIYKGSTDKGSQLVSFNRGFNPKNAKADFEASEKYKKKYIPFEYSDDKGNETRGLWGGASILNFSEIYDVTQFGLKNMDPSFAIEEIYDEGGCQEVRQTCQDKGISENFSDTKFSFSKDPGLSSACQSNFILTEKPKNANPKGVLGEYEDGYFKDEVYRLPIKANDGSPITKREPINWTSYTKNQKFTPSKQTSAGKTYTLSQLGSMLKSVPGGASICEGGTSGDGSNDGVETASDCLINGIELWYAPNGGKRTLARASTYDGDKICPVTRYRYEYTSVEGLIKHESPTTKTLNNQIKNPGIKSLPINKNRYLEIFTGDFVKIPYPYMFRVKAGSGVEDYDNSGELSIEKGVNNFNFERSGILYDENTEGFLFISKVKNILKDFNLEDLEKLIKINKIIEDNNSELSIFVEIEDILLDDIGDNDKINKLNDFINEYYNKNLYKNKISLTEIQKKPIKTIEEAKKLLDLFLEDYDNRTANRLSVRDYLLNKSDQVIKIGEEEKTFNYYDFLSFSVLWNNMPSVSAKYKFILENYLSDQVGGNDFKFILPKNKKQYEISYMGAFGDAQNMYIKLNPEEKSNINPYSDIFSKNKLLDSNKISIGVLNGTNKINYNGGNTSNLPSVNYQDGLFKCAPPEGVPIWEWIPAVMCRIGGLLPPEVSIGAGQCSSSTIFNDSINGINYYSLLKEQEKSIDNRDSDKNGINDLCEKQITNNGKLRCTGGSSRYYFNQNGIINAEVLDKDNNRVMLDNSSYITFKLKKIIDIETGNVVFDGKKDNFNDKKEIINEYINFNELEVRSQYGKSTYSFATKDKEADIYFETKLDLKDNKNKSVHKLTSNTIIIKIRKSRLFLSSKMIISKDNIDFGNTLNVNNNTNIYIYDEKNTKLDLTNVNENSIVLGLFNIGEDGKNKNINFPINVTLMDSKNKVIIKEKLNSLNGINGLFSIKKAGSYKIIIEDNYKFKVEKNIEILALDPSKLKIDLGTSILEKKESISNNLISIYDKFDNLVLGNTYNFDLNILGDSIVFDNDSKNLNISTYEGFKAFRLKSSGKSGISKLKVDLYKNNKKLLTLSKNINVIDVLNLDIKYNDVLKVGNNEYEAELEFKDKNNNILNNLNSRVYISSGEEYIEFLEAYYDIINGKAKVKFKTKTLAGENKVLSFRVEGFNSIIYKNIDILPEKAFGISFVNTKTQFEANSSNDYYINIEIKDIYNNVVFTDSNSIITSELLDEYKKFIKYIDVSKKIHKGKASFKFKVSELPGKAYFKFSINKELEKNEFVIGDNKKEIKINGVSENSLEIDTFFFYNKKSIKNKKYNTLYTTLLGAEYGDITQKDYLASAMLFDKNNRSLAVTSLLNSPYNELDLLSISDKGIIKKTYNKADLTQDISVTLKKDLLNNKYYLNLFNSALNKYIGKIYLNFDDLNINEDILNNIKNLEELDLKSIFDLKQINIEYALNRVKLNNLLSNKNSVIIYIESSDYKIKKLSSGIGNSISVYYNDPFSTEYSLNNFSNYSLDTYDNFLKNKKVGWGAGNKTLLAFSAGENVGDSTKQYMGVSGINLGDPIISLKKIKKNSYGIIKKFDSTIGKRLNKNEIKTYKVFDYNADNLRDILFVDGTGTISLLENTKASKGFLDQKNLAKIVDLGKFDLVVTGDFSGDKYEDIFFVNNKGQPFLLDNNNKNFVRVDLTKIFNLKGKIVNAISFDMDNDGLGDIVTLDTGGEINIFYGNLGTINFTKKNIYSGYGLELNKGIRNNNAAVYFDGLTQNITNGNNISDSTKTRGVDILENMMFENIVYDSNIDLNKENSTKNTKFIKSEFASQVGLDIKRTYNDINGGKLNTGDIIEVEVILKNISNKTLNKIVYLENIDKFFTLDFNSIKTSKNININGGLGNYKIMFENFNLNSGEILKIHYKTKTNSLSYGNIEIGLFEKGELGDDEYGDILLGTSKYNCGQTRDLFRSTDKREYNRGVKENSCDESELPNVLAKNDIDKDKNGIPDYIDELEPINPDGNKNNPQCSGLKGYCESSLDEYGENNQIKEENKEDNIYNKIDNINNKIDEFSSDIDNLIEGFGCGFGGGNCFAMPINWAPLAPGNDISTPFGLIGDGLKVGEGLPVFSTLTGFQTSNGCIPSFWPMSPLAYVPGFACGPISAGGYLGTWSPTNTFRFFITPTLTGGVGAAACFGGPASNIGNLPGSGVSPFIPFGNCVVAAAPFPNLCADEEIAGDPSFLGPVKSCNGKCGTNKEGTKRNNALGFGYINANCNQNNKPLPISNKIDASLASEYLNYRNSGVQSSELIKLVDSRFSNIEDRKIDYNSSLLQNQPLCSIGGQLVDDADISVSFNSQDGFKFNEIEELRMQKIAPFPRFITQWVNDQIEEFITKLVDFPTLSIILPDFSKIFDTDWEEYTQTLISETEKSFNKAPNFNSGIKEAYEFLGNVPFVSIEGETVNINIPEIDPEYYETIITQWKLALESYPKQIQEAIDSGIQNPESIISAREFMKNLEINIGILETYKDIPGAISQLFNKKQDYLEQIMCNIETIENVTGNWLGFNGKRFKAWVELYILIKAILKSWQLLVDIFQDYEEQCHECKNERWDSTQWEWTMISMIIPPIPVIQFPKWPDITLDFSNIRLNLAIKLPEFKVNSRPIILPPAPVLLLPDYNFIVPPLKRLPLLEIPELPDIPSLPTINLPDLPPPPNLPKIWSSIESFLKILKLIVKMMCILKKVPLVPEHRVGSQIAFLTEGGGFRGFDFIDQLLPNFSYPYLDEIKVTSYVNLEFETDFITEMARTIVSPINNMTNDFTNIFNNKGIDDLDLTDYSKTSYSGEEINSRDFLSLINKELSKDYIFNNPDFDELRKSFDIANNYTYSKEDKLINDLQKTNYEKFDILKSIIKREIKKSKDLKIKSKEIFNNKSLYRKISNDNIDNIKIYNKSLKKYNDAFKQSAKNLLNPTYFDTESIKKSGNNILKEVKYTTDNYNEFVSNKYENSFLNTNNSKNILALNTTNNKQYLSAVSSTSNSGGSCSSQKTSKYSRNYEGIYIIQESGNTKINYKLFDYLDDLTGDEYITPIDYDRDGDADLLYLVDGNLYLKENLINNKKDKNYLSGIEVLDIDDNKFINGEITYEAVNGLIESYVANEFINVNFQASNREDISNYRFEYYSIIDKYLNEGNSSYIPENIEKNIVDSFAGIDDSTVIKTGTGYVIRKNLAYIYEIGNNIPEIILKTKELLNIKNSLDKGNLAIISGNTKIYAGGTKAIIKYQEIEGEEIFTKTINKNSSLELDNAIKIIELSGNAYIKGDKNITLIGNEIYKFKGLPLFEETKIFKKQNFITNSSSHIGIRYYDTSEANLDFRKIKSYEIYNLGLKTYSYSINLETQNDYFYSRISMFKDNSFGTKTSQILLSPQKESDIYAPELDFNGKIRIPVYQKKIIDLTDSLYENSGFENIESFIIEGIENTKYKIIKSSEKYQIEFGKFDKIFTKNIKFIISDLNGNILKKDITLEVYPPIPEITSYTGSIISGNINENLSDEPINLYRFRGGSLKRLKTNSGTTTVDTNNGSFNFNINTLDSNLIDIKVNNSNIFTINENTGKINLLDEKYRIKATINDDNFIETSIIDNIGEQIFSQTIKTNSNNIDIKITKSFSDLESNGLYLRLTNQDFDYYKIPDSVPINPGSIVIYRKADSTKEPLFAILPDSRIKPLNGFYKIEYSTFDNFIVIKLIDRHFNKEIGQLLLKLDSSYVIQ